MGRQLSYGRLKRKLMLRDKEQVQEVLFFGIYVSGAGSMLDQELDSVGQRFMDCLVGGCNGKRRLAVFVDLGRIAFALERKKKICGIGFL